jgi:hypothetical protein
VKMLQFDTCFQGHVSTVTGTVDTRQNGCIFVVHICLIILGNFSTET